jgi:hypothetical protein
VEPPDDEIRVMVKLSSVINALSSLGRVVGFPGKWPTVQLLPTGLSAEPRFLTLLDSEWIVCNSEIIIVLRVHAKRGYRKLGFELAENPTLGEPFADTFILCVLSSLVAI